MNSARRTLCATGALLAVTALSGCALANFLIWGPEATEVIDETEAYIDLAAAGDADALACEGTTIDTGDAEIWIDLAAGEPEQFNADYWEQVEDADASWTINIEGSGPAPIGTKVPGSLVFKDTEEGLCVVHLEWATMIG
ncbi:hypothetical protein [Humidisolicoccus flavus]|uniref:hypothetical protein n=1 Tax=Humidisolicoccus flavus TaxID=3111414 RepID=UPI003246D59D